MSNFNINQFVAEFNNGFQRNNQYRCRIELKSHFPALAKRYPKAVEYLSRGLLCESTRTPSRSFDTKSMSVFGYEEKYPIFTTYNDMECTFLTPLIQDETVGGPTNQVMELFTAWQNLIQPRTSPGSFGATPILNNENMVLRFPSEYRLEQGMTLEMLNPYNTKRNTPGIGINTTVRLPIVGSINLQASLTTEQNDEQFASPTTMAFSFFNVYPLTVESSQVSWADVDVFQTVTVSFAYSYWSSTRPAPLA